MPAVFVTGHSRSGTSLTAGLLASQGVWFGPCHGPRDINQKGFFESTFFKECIRKRSFRSFNDRWDEWRAQNYAGGTWGIKTGPEYYKYFEYYNPVVICTYRPEEAILDSRRRAGFAGGKAAIRKANARIKRLPFHTVTVFPDEFVSGDFSSLITALRPLGMDFNRAAAEEWVDPILWSGNVR